MTTITGYYLLKQLQRRKSQRFDVVAHAGDCIAHLEDIGRRARGGRAYCYVTTIPPQFNAVAHAQATRALTSTKSITSLYTPAGASQLTAFGDVKGTTDALLIRFSADYNEMELFVARGLKPQAAALFFKWMAGKLDTEADQLRQRATQAAAASPTTEQPAPELCTIRLI